jgi:hypothetical protein
MWEIESGIQDVITHLERLYLQPARRLELARMYSIPHWVEPAFKILIYTDFADISASDIQQMGLTEFSILCKAKEKIEKERKLTAAVPPSMNFAESWSCRTHENCKKIWREVWWRKVARQILHPNSPLAFDTACEAINKIEFPGMTESCRIEMMEIIRTGPMLFDLYKNSNTVLFPFTRVLCLRA